MLCPDPPLTPPLGFLPLKMDKASRQRTLGALSVEHVQASCPCCLTPNLRGSLRDLHPGGSGQWAVAACPGLLPGSLHGPLSSDLSPAATSAFSPSPAPRSPDLTTHSPTPALTLRGLPCAKNLHIADWPEAERLRAQTPPHVQPTR